MPTTRASAGRPAQNPPSQSTSQQRQQLAQEVDIIVISSDDEATLRQIKNPKRTKRARDKSNVVPSTNIVEVSSDEKEPHRTTKNVQTSTLIALQTKIKTLEQENCRLKEDSQRSTSQLIRVTSQVAKLHRETEDLHRKNIEASRLQREAEDLRLAAVQARQAGPSLAVSSLEDHVTCQVCALKLWSPYILAECGHTFCESCLQDWFKAALAQHKIRYPHYNVNQPISAAVRDALRHPVLGMQIMQQVMALQPPQPHYTCPICREVVKTRPVEDYTLKALVRVVAQASGESSPRKAAQPRHATVQRQNPWDAFFPQAPAR